jgi:hypothetical protein
MVSNKQPNVNVKSYAFPRILLKTLAIPNYHSCSPDKCIYADGFKNERCQSTECVGPQYVYKYDSSCLLFILFVECSNISDLLGTPSDSSSPVAFYFCPDISSTASVHAVSAVQYRLGHTLTHHMKNPTHQKPQDCLIYLSGSQFETGTKEPLLGYTSRVCPLYPSYVCRSIPKSPISPHVLWVDVVWCSAFRIVYSCQWPSVEFNTTSHSWECRESSCTMLNWLHQAILRYGECPH